jgi:enamine deaminase RidA (YjgF/YER057c/UK114 family)
MKKGQIMRELPMPSARVLVPLLLAASAAGAQEPPDPARRLAELGITLPAVSPPIANYVPWVFSGNQLWLAGHVPAATGRLGADLTIGEGYAAARETCIRLLATMQAALEGDLSRVRRIIRVTGFVQATPEFTDHPRVVNGCSDLLVEVFGDAGRHSRASLGVASLPAGRAVELDLVAEVRPPR